MTSSGASSGPQTDKPDPRPPLPPVGRSGLCALSVHKLSPCGPKPPSGDVSAGERAARLPMKCIGTAGHPPRFLGSGGPLYIGPENGLPWGAEGPDSLLYVKGDEGEDTRGQRVLALPWVNKGAAKRSQSGRRGKPAWYFVSWRLGRVKVACEGRL
jgi:hypothetical protein